MKFITTTKEGTSGFNISYEDEKKCADTLAKVLPDWIISFEWCQVLFNDVQYQIDEEKKIVHIQYNKNLKKWWSKLLPELKDKLIKQVYKL